MTLKLVLPVLSLGVALIACKGEVQIGSKAPDPQPTVAAPAPTPTPTPTVEAPKPAPVAPAPKLISVGKLRQEGNQIVVPGNIEFASGSAVVNMGDATTKEIMDSMLELLQKNPSLKVRIAGHTDNEGGKDYNQKLSEQRAAAVVKYFTDKGVTADRLKSEGHGMDMPLCKNDSTTHKKFNRRTEFTITEMDGKPMTQDPNKQPVCPDQAPAGGTPAPK